MMRQFVPVALLSLICMLLTISEAAKLPKFKTKYDTLVARCEPIQITMCKGQAYNQTHFPNLMGHETQTEANLELITYAPLIRLGCSPDLLPFLCSLYAPVCMSVKDSLEMLIPCRHKCKRVRKGCAKIMKKYGFNWPTSLRCKRFPRKKRGSLCIDWGAPTNGKGRRSGKRNKQDRRKGRRKDKNGRKKNNKKDRRNKKKNRKDGKRRPYSG